jgi:hypothetical protein
MNYAGNFIVQQFQVLIQILEIRFMKVKNNTLPLNTVGLAVAIMLTACGGGGGSSSPLTLSGAVIDGYIKGATVCLDVNANGVCDTGEPTSTTDVKGAYSINVPVGTSVSGLHLIAVVPAGAVDSDTPGTPIANAYKLMAPVDMPAVISPLTTVVSSEMIANGKSEANARIQARSTLALPVDYDFMKDHVATATSDTHAHNVAKVMAAILAVKVGTGTPNASTLGLALAQIKAGTTAADAYASSDVSAVVSGILGTPTPTPTPTPTSCATSSMNCIGFQEATIGVNGFEGLISASVVADPVSGASNPVLKLVKGPTGQPWAGATVYTAGTLNPDPTVHSALSVARFGLESSKIVTMRSYSGAAVGTVITLKLENDANPGVNIAAEAVTTKQNGWEVLTFNFANTSTGVYSSAANYNTASVFPAFSIPDAHPAAPASNTTFYFDELKYAVFGATPTPTPTPSATTIVTFDEATAPTLADFGQGAALSVVTGPTGGSGKAAKMVKGTGQPSWNGMFWTLPTPITPTSTTATFTAQVWADTAGTGNRLYIEDTGGGQVVITSASPGTLATGQWQTVTWNFTGIDTTKTYTKMGFVPNFGGATTSAPETYYLDTVTYLSGSAPAPSPTPSPTPSGTFSTGFKSNFTTVEGGAYYPKSGGSMDNYGCTSPGTTTQCGSGGAYTDGATPVSAASSGFFSYYQIPVTNTSVGEYVGVGILAPGVAALSGTADTPGTSVAGKTNLNFGLAQNPEWYGITNGNNFMISMDMGKVYAGGCHVQLRAIVTPTAQAASYSVPLSTFAVVQDCGTSISLANALAQQSVAQISFEGDAGVASVGVGSKFGTANTTVASGAWYPTTVRINGGINFN